MDLAVQNYQTKQAYKPAFKGPLDGIVTNTFRTLDTNEMMNAVALDVGAMVIPRTYIDTKKRNKYAGSETFFREICGTFINCLSAGLLAIPIAKLACRYINPKVNINSKSWFSNDSLMVLKNSWDRSSDGLRGYVKNVFGGMKGHDGDKVVTWNDINWKNVEWIDEKSWGKIKWENPAYKNIQEKLKTGDGIVNTLVDVIKSDDISNGDRKNIFRLLEARVTNALGVNRSVDVTSGKYSMNATLSNIIRDTYDMGKDIFTNPNVNIDAALEKITKVNKVKILGALSLASVLGLTNQYINRQITKKRTGSTKFVGDIDYESSVTGIAAKVEEEKKGTGFFFRKLAASAGIIAMAIGVMRIKTPKDFIRKLEFTGPISSGNAIKTVYTSTLVGRFMAADNDTELRESVTRDYFGFLNWLVLGGFAAKGAANLLDKKKEFLFNINKQGKGLKHWLNDITLKSHTEIAAKGSAFARNNMWKLNVAHLTGLAYSTVALGFMVPLFNIAVAEYKKKHQNAIGGEQLNIRPDIHDNLPVAFEAFKK